GQVFERLSGDVMVLGSLPKLPRVPRLPKVGGQLLLREHRRTRVKCRTHPQLFQSWHSWQFWQFWQ
ncbi:MAG TPA: hypothetical protein VFT24_09660, partial [Vicinamibacterales bacterium]|nr:hypothetical protein [Vicinamibacterales bacterium]